MTDAEMDERLRQLREGFDIAIERVLRQKAHAGNPVVVADEQGVPSLRNARQSLTEFLKSKE